MYTVYYLLYWLPYQAGVIWLVHDGESYVNKSMELEYAYTQGGTLKDFVNMKSARVAIGVDGDGAVMIVQVDGRSNLYTHSPII